MRWIHLAALIAACSSTARSSDPPAELPERVEERAAAPEAPPEATLPAEVSTDDEPCPPFHPPLPVGSMSMGPSLVGGLYPSDLDAMLAALPEHAGAWTRTRSGTTQRGTAGVAMPNATATLARGDDEVRIDVFDLIHRCRCTPGMGETLRDRVLAHAEGGREARTFGGSPGVIIRSDGATTVEAWVGDRCQVRVAGAVTAEQLLVVTAGVDWERLRAPCAARAGAP
jgi:hypothetical protein